MTIREYFDVAVIGMGAGFSMGTIVSMIRWIIAWFIRLINKF